MAGCMGRRGLRNSVGGVFGFMGRSGGGRYGREESSGLEAFVSWGLMSYEKVGFILFAVNMFGIGVCYKGLRLWFINFEIFTKYH